MLGNPKWFTRRKYSGWGLTPATWQGWAYVGAFLFAVAATYALVSWMGLQRSYQIGAVLGVLALFIIDSLDIALRMDKDEREVAHEALAERNAAWVMVLVLLAGVVFQVVVSSLRGNLCVDPFLIAALLGGVVAKAMTNWYLLDK